MRKKTYLIYSSSIDQALAIRKFIKKYCFGCNIITESTFNKNPDQNINCVLIPTGAISTENLLKQRNITLGEITLTQSSLQVFDKLWLLSQCFFAEVSIPETWSNINNISNYPVFYKQSHEKGGGERGVAYSQEEIPRNNLESLIFQELIVSKGTYGVGFLADSGELLCTHTHFEKESIPKTGGSAVIIDLFSDDKLYKHTKSLIKQLNYSGWGLAEFKYCPKRKDYVLMEINAKFWASCEMAFINEPKFLKLLFNIDSKEKPVKSVFFIDRALQRGMPFFIRNISLLFDKNILKIYPVLSLSTFAKLIPKSIQPSIKKILLKIWKK